MSVDSKLLEEKKERTAKTIRRESVDKPPFLLTADGYYPVYFGIEKKDITTIEQAVDIAKRFSDELQPDTNLMPFMPANIVYGKYESILGGGCQIVKDYSKQLNPEAVTIMEPNEYPELIKDPLGYMLETLIPRRLKLLADNSFENKLNGLLGWMGEVQKMVNITTAQDEAGIPVLMGPGVILAPTDYIFDYLRDFVGITRDIKRSPDLVNEASMAILETLKPLVHMYPPEEHKAVFMPMHIPAFLRPKDFEKAYWPSYKAIMEYLVSMGRNVVCYFEKNNQHLFDYLQDLPKNGVIGIFQEEDMRVTKEKLGSTMALAGWLSTNLLQRGTKEQCIDNVKELIDVMCPGGGYFIAPDTPMMFPADGKPENLKAVADFIRDYRF